jgi:hypothetical protein
MNVHSPSFQKFPQLKVSAVVCLNVLDRSNAATAKSVRTLDFSVSSDQRRIKSGCPFAAAVHPENMQNGRTFRLGSGYVLDFRSKFPHVVMSHPKQRAFKSKVQLSFDIFC